MAISDDGKRGQVGPSLRGLIYQYERSGRWVTSKWPKKRGRQATEKQKLAQQAFRDCMLAMKLTAAEIQMFHREAAKGTPMLPRDTLMAALYGNGPTINFYSGKVVKPMANKYLASTVLDAIGWQKGDLLYRGDDLWEVLPIGNPGEVLTLPNDGGTPVWAPPPAAGSGGRIMNLPQGLSTSPAMRTNCLRFWLFEEFTLSSLTIIPTANMQASGELFVFSGASSTTPGVQLHYQVFDFSAASINSPHLIELSVPVALTPGQYNFIALCFSGGGSSTRQTLRQGSQGLSALMAQTPGGLYSPNPPAVGAPMSASSEAYFFAELNAGA